MDDRAFLHEGETLLASVRPSVAFLLLGLLQGLLDILLFGVIASIGASIVSWFMAGAFPALWIFILLFILVAVAVWMARFRLWRHSMFRVTTERMLVQYYPSLFSKKAATIKWLQYQESHVGHRNILDFLTGSRSLCIRHGTADAHVEVCFPSLRYASDLKHYLDKVDSFVKKNDTASLRPFVPKPRGQRDADS